MNAFARIVLVLTALAPMVVVAGASWWGSDRAWPCFAIAALLCVICLGLMHHVRTQSESIDLKITKVSRADKNVLAFLFTYCLPLLTATTWTSQAGANPLGLFAFAFVVFLVLLQTKIADVNPVLAIFGYHFFEVEAGDLGSVLLITKQSTIAAGYLGAARLSDYLWLDKGEPSRPLATPAAGTTRPTR